MALPSCVPLLHTKIYLISSLCYDHRRTYVAFEEAKGPPQKLQVLSKGSKHTLDSDG